MRICHVVESGAGGVGNVVIDLVQRGIQAGDDVTVIYGTARTWPQFLDTLAKTEKVKLAATPMQRAVGLHDMRDGWKLWTALRRNGPFDVIHAHSSKAGALVRLLRPFFPKSVILYTPHAFITLAPGASPVYGWIEWLLGWFSDAIICLSAEEKQHAVARLHLPPRKLIVIPNGTDLNFPNDRAAARARMGTQDSDFIVGFVGRLEAQKNPERAVEAFAKAAAGRPHLRMAIVGHGSLQDALEQTISGLGLKDRIAFITDFSGRSLVAGFDCLLCSSDYEGFGLVILEALAAGVPVVMTPVGGSEAVLSGKTGHVTSEFTAAALAEGIVKIAACDTAQKTQMAAAAKNQAQKFSLESMAGKTRALYTELLEQK